MGSFITRHSQIPKKKTSEELIFFNSKLSKLPPVVFSLSGTLKKLDLSRNRLSNITTHIRTLTVLEELNLSCNCFTEVPHELFQLSSLKSLDLSFNHITSVNPNVSGLKNLRTLILKTNKLCQLPLELGNLVSLETLRLENNFLEHLPETIAKLTNLTVLNVACNELDKLPDSLEQWASAGRIEEIVAFGNALTEVPSYISKLTSLTVLSLARNQLVTLPPELLSSLHKLNRLVLAANKLRSPLASHIALPMLTELDLRGNEFTTLPDLKDLTSLRVLDISFNPLDTLPTEMLQQLTSLQLIKIHYKQLHSNLTVDDEDDPTEDVAEPLKDIIKIIDAESNNEKTLRTHATKIQFIHHDLDIEYLQTAIPQIDKIMPNLYLSSAHGANNYRTLVQLEVTHVLTVAEELQPRFPHSFYYHVISVGDNSFLDDIAQHLKVCTRFIDQGRKYVTTPSASGVSRSVTAVCAYLMEYQKLSLEKAIMQIKDARPIAKPNPGFWEQLLNFESELNKTR